MTEVGREESAKPTAYMAVGTYASFPSPAVRLGHGRRGAGDRSVGVQSTARQDSTRSRQTRLTPHRSVPLTVKHGESGVGGLQQNHGSNTASGRLDVARNAQVSCHCARFHRVATEYY